MNAKRLLQKLACGALAAAITASSLSYVGYAPQKTTVQAASEVRASSYSALNFSFSGADSEKTVDVSELILRATGESVGGAEADYLRSLGIVMTYDDDLSENRAQISTDADSLTITVGARTYRAYNGAQIRWVPTHVEIDGRSQSFAPSQSGYSATFYDLDSDHVYTATMFFETTISVSGYAIAPVLNIAYDDAMEALDLLERYEEEKLLYDQALADYQNALKEYEAKYAEYQAYQQDITRYNTALAQYEDYMKKKTAYEKALAAFNAYESAIAQYDELYAAYEKALTEYPDKLAAYEDYLARYAVYQKELSKLDIMSCMFVSDSKYRAMYNTLMGDTVAQVMAQKDVLVNYAGASGADIDNAGDATSALQKLLTEYKALKTPEAKYEWYYKNYETVKSNFILLYSSLANLGHNVAVQRKLRQEGKFERYAQFVGHLYIISTGLDDSTTFDSSWDYYDGTVGELVESCHHITDHNSYAPTGLPELGEVVDKPVMPTAPKKPAEVTKPVKNWTEDLSHPGEAPKAVAKPTMPNLSDYTAGTPQMPAIGAQLAAVVEEVKAGTLKRRSSSASDVQMSFTAATSCAVSRAEYPIVTFYDYDKKTVLATVRVEPGERAVYNGATPSRPSDEENSYRFVGWADAAGNLVSLTNVRSNITVYAKYEQVKNTYQIMWMTGKGTITQSVEYGKTPVYPGDPSYTDSHYQYIFTGWSPAVTAVKGNAVYSAQYTKRALSDITYSVVLEVRGEKYYRTYAYGEMPDLSAYEKDYVQGGVRYVFKGWSPELKPVTGNTTYRAIFEQTQMIPAGDDGKAEVSLTVSDKTHTVTTDACKVDASYVVELAVSAGTDLVLNMGGATVTVPKAILAAMPEAAYFSLTPASAVASDYAEARANTLAWTLEITDKNGKPVALSDEILLALPLPQGASEHGRFRAYVNGAKADVTIDGGNAYLYTAQTGDILLCPYYAVTLLTEGEGGDVVVAETAEGGAAVSVQIVCEPGYRLQSLTLTALGGEALPIDAAEGFTMPESDVTLCAVFEKAQYAVVFVANGVEISRELYYYGDKVKEPDMTDKLVVRKDGTDYTFAGWNAVISAVTGDATYTAKYEKGTVGSKDDTYISDHDSNRLITVGLPVAIAVFVLGAGALAAWLLKKKRGINVFLIAKNAVVKLFRKKDGNA